MNTDVHVMYQVIKYREKQVIQYQMDRLRLQNVLSIAKGRLVAW